MRRRENFRLTARAASVAALTAATFLPAAAFADGTARAAIVKPTAASTCTAWTSSTTPPSTIKVLITSGSTKVRVDTVSFKTYVQNVLPNEWESGWKPASLQAGAVAAKQYGWYFTMNAGHGGTFNGSCYDVTDNTSSQVYRSGTATTTTNAAIDATWGATLTQGGALIQTSYRANLTGSNSEGCGAGVSSLPNTMSQWGSQACAVAGENYEAILATYYPGAQLVQAGSGSFAGMARTKAGTGYYTLTRDGAVHPHGTAPTFGDAHGQSYFAGQTAVAIVLDGSGNGYWILSNTGGVYSYGDAPFFGSAAGQSYFAGQSATSLVLDAAASGYWILSNGGGVYSYGSAPFFGSAAGQSYFAGQTAVGMALDGSGNGYWILSNGGGIYSYGDAPFFGSAAGQSYFAGQSATSLVLDAAASGYWILSNGGGVYSYGSAPFFGSAAGQSYFAGQTAVGMALDASGNGYWIVAVSGGIYSYGDAPFYGAA